MQQAANLDAKSINITTKKENPGRIQSVDMLRGFALIGILFANILWYSGYLDSPNIVRGDLLNTSIFDETVLFLTRLLVHGKFYFIYSFLFGLGFYILYSRASSRYPSFSRYFIKRQLILFLIGCIHAVFIWWGDILRYYALIGLVLLLIKDWKPEHLLKLALALLLTPLLMDIVNAQWSISLNLSFAPESNKTVLLGLYQQGQWFDANFDRMLIGLQGNINSGRLLRIMGMFIMGYYFGQIRFFTESARSSLMQKRLIAFALLVALPLSLLKTGASYYDYGFTKMTATLVKEFLYVISVTGMSLGYIALIAYFGNNLQQTLVGRWLQTLGRVPLTNYILQSVIGFVIFQGLGLFAEVPLFQAYILSIVIIAVQLFLSIEWLKRRKMGPVEELWRRIAS
ncbi:DUF418 domain-containing protein [Psychromonas ossibalaenae]|uniref:DUF418 domain-containing protein n=1 Tax=Psychromonas ossibalaenae TaxID=444922 RepID=UPI0003705981|nr:DUF418 domain-containing protein [Psychromonas ossibalaenae]